MADTSLTTEQLARSAGQFFSWWRQQLWECLPAGYRARAQQRKRPAMLQPAENRYWPVGADLSRAQALDRSALWGQGGQGVALVLGEANGFRRDVELPASVEDKYAQVLAFELDRLTPLKAADLFYDFHLKRRNAARGSITVELTAAPKARVTPLLNDCAARRIQVDRLLLSASDVDSGFNLLNSNQSPEARESDSRSLWINLGLAGLCAALLAAIIVTPLWQQRQHVIAMQPVEGQAKAEAEATSALQQQLDAKVTAYNLPLSRKHRYPLAVQVLDDLTKRLPDDTWAQTVEVKAVPGQPVREVSIQGETGSGGKILQLVQESPLLKEPAFKAALTRVTPEAERYHIVGQLITADMPQQLQLADGPQEMVLPGSPVSVKPPAPAGAPAAGAHESPPPAPLENGAPPLPSPGNGEPGAIPEAGKKPAAPAGPAGGKP